MMTVEILTRLCHNAFLPGQQVLLRTYPDAGDPASNLLCLIVEITSLIQGHLSTHLLSLACDPSASSITPYEVGFYFYYGTACTHLVTSVTSGFVKPSQTLIAKRVSSSSLITTSSLYSLVHRGTGSILYSPCVYFHCKHTPISLLFVSCPLPYAYSSTPRK